MRNLVPFLALLAFALALPSLLGLLPSWFIPSRWSDFSAWSSLFDKAGAHLSEYLSATPYLRDTDEGILLLKRIGLCLAASLCALPACFRWHIRGNISNIIETLADEFCFACEGSFVVWRIKFRLNFVLDFFYYLMAVAFGAVPQDVKRVICPQTPWNDKFKKICIYRLRFKSGADV